MLRRFQPRAVFAAAVAALLVSLSGCTSFHDYIHNGFKVGPNYCKPGAPVAEHWIDAPNLNEGQRDDLSQWWLVFRDPVLNEPDPVLNCLVQTAYHQNLTLRQAGSRILEARAQLGITTGQIFPQTQTAAGAYNRIAAPITDAGGNNIGTSYLNSWATSFNLNWELDFWGKFRRAIASADDSLNASVEDYDGAIVTMLGDVATNYVRIRTDQEQIRLLKKNVVAQRWVYEFFKKRYAGGYGIDVRVSMDQALGVLRQTQAQIPVAEIDLRKANDALCVLLGLPTMDLREVLPLWKSVDEPKQKMEEEERAFRQRLLDQEGALAPEDLQRVRKIVNLIYIPTVPAPAEVGVGIPADLLRRRPDVREAERKAAAQGEQIGIAQADLYPAFSINGSIGFTAKNFPALFDSRAFNGSVGPSFQWSILNYGRIVNNVRLQDATFQELVYTYQQIVLTSDQEVEDGLTTYLRSHQVAKLLEQGVEAYTDATAYMTLRKGAGVIDGNAWNLTASNLVQQEVAWAQQYGNIPAGLIAVYRALGGGWEMRLCPPSTEAQALDMLPANSPGTPSGSEPVPTVAPSDEPELPPAVPQPAPYPPRPSTPAVPATTPPTTSATPAVSGAPDLPPAPDRSAWPPSPAAAVTSDGPESKP